MLTIAEPVFVYDASGVPVAAVVPIADDNVLLDALEEINDLRIIAEMRATGEFTARIPLANVLVQQVPDTTASITP